MTWTYYHNTLQSKFPTRTLKTSNQRVVSNVYRVLIGSISSPSMKLSSYPNVL